MTHVPLRADELLFLKEQHDALPKTGRWYIGDGVERAFAVRCEPAGWPLIDVVPPLEVGANIGRFVVAAHAAVPRLLSHIELREQELIVLMKAVDNVLACAARERAGGGSGFRDEIQTADIDGLRTARSAITLAPPA